MTSHSDMNINKAIKALADFHGLDPLEALGRFVLTVDRGDFLMVAHDPDGSWEGWYDGTNWHVA